MRLVFAIVQNEDGQKVIDALNEKGFSVTKLATTGGFFEGGEYDPFNRRGGEQG